MSTALVEPIVESPKTAAEGPKLAPKLEVIAAQVREEPRKGDPHPLVPVFVIGGIALIGALAFVGSIIMLLVLRHSGVMAP